MEQTHVIIWEQFSRELKSFLCNKLNHEDHCNDILQEIYLKIFINKGKLEKVRNVRAYLFQMAHNAVMDHYRRTAKATVIAVDQLPDTGLETALPPGEYFLADCLRTMINALPGIYSEALVLTELEGLTQKQYAEKAGISLSGAKSRVQRAREKLKEEIINCCQYEFDKYGNILSCCKNGPPKKSYC